ncbi:hypothetical protein LSH36_430g01031 [Paralvinella palmiformis]|uniref:Uncharacterized protein n=1 Tax=Paralvinella palmiformis TaxID=53620 RepID=A0AAD9JB36_9ANNE|nr:hypothetical protein LSH36_430g01031 [Paralvinella palmiformis]
MCHHDRHDDDGDDDDDDDDGLSNFSSSCVTSLPVCHLTCHVLFTDVVDLHLTSNQRLGFENMFICFVLMPVEGRVTAVTQMRECARTCARLRIFMCVYVFVSPYIFIY